MKVVQGATVRYSNDQSCEQMLPLTVAPTCQTDRTCEEAVMPVAASAIKLIESML